MNDETAPLLEHLVELRARLIRIAIVFFASFALCYYFAEPLFRFLVQPLADLSGGHPERRLIYTHLTEAFTTYLRVGLFGAFFMTLPYLLAQLWHFVAPGLYHQERKIIYPLLVATPLLFIAGAAGAYYWVCPMAWSFFLSFEAPSMNGSIPIQLEARVSEYLSLIMKLLMSFGISFELPVLLVVLAINNVVSLEALQRNRKYAFLAIIIVAAIITPPDLISPLSLTIPLYALYEVSIVIVKIYKKEYAGLEK